MARPEKEAAVSELVNQFTGSTAAILTEYRGLTVAQLKELRTALRPNATYAVVKNTLAKIAAREAGIGATADVLTGPTAIAFVTGDPVAVAKQLREYARTHHNLVLKGGVLEGATLAKDEVVRLADMDSREVTLAKVAGVVKASLNKTAYLFTAPAAKAVRTIDALREEQASAA